MFVTCSNYDSLMDLETITGFLLGSIAGYLLLLRRPHGPWDHYRLLTGLYSWLPAAATTDSWISSPSASKTPRRTSILRPDMPGLPPRSNWGQQGTKTSVLGEEKQAVKERLGGCCNHPSTHHYMILTWKVNFLKTAEIFQLCSSLYYICMSTTPAKNNH